MKTDQLHKKSTADISEKESTFTSASLLPVLLACIIIFSPKLLNANPISAPSTLSEIIQEGLTNNEELHSLKARIESLKHEAVFAGSLEDPRIGVGLLNLPTNSFDFSQEPMTQKQIFIAQKVPWFGKRDLRSQGVEYMADRQEAFLSAKQLELSEKIASAYYELGFIEESLEVNEKLSSLLDQILRVAEARYSSGEGLQQDVLQAQVEQSLLFEEKTLLQKNKQVIQDRLNELLNRKTFAPVTYLALTELPELDLHVAALQKESLKKNPLVLVKQAEINQAKTKIELARKNYLPNVDFMAAYGQREEDASGRNLPDFFSATMTFTVPLWKKKRQDSKLAAEQKEFEAAEKNYNNLVTSLPHRVDALVTEMNETRKNYLFYRDALILQAEQWAASALSGYEVGKVAFDTMIGAQVRLLRLELKSRQYLFTYYKKRAELEKLIGSPLDAESLGKENESLQQTS